MYDSLFAIKRGIIVLQTIFGNLSIAVNGMNYEYSPKELSNIITGRSIDKRYIMEIKDFIHTKEETKIEIGVSFRKQHPAVNIETGENLFSVSFEEHSNRLSIGVAGDIPDVHYDHICNGISLHIPADASIDKIEVAVAWTHIKNIEDGILTWLAADPSYNR